MFQVLSGILSNAQDISKVRQPAFLAGKYLSLPRGLRACHAHVHIHRQMHTHPTSFSPLLLAHQLTVFPPQAKKKNNPVENHFLAKLQPTKGKQAGISPNYCPNHQSTQLPGQQRKDAVRGTVLADPVSAASGARSLRVQASCLERQPLSPD